MTKYSYNVADVPNTSVILNGTELSRVKNYQVSWTYNRGKLNLEISY